MKRFADLTPEERLFWKVSQDADKYLGTHFNCGPTHKKAYIAGARYMYNLIKLQTI